MSIRMLIAVLLAVAALSGCGRRGALEEPGSRPDSAMTGVTSAPVNDGASPLDPGSTIAAPGLARQQAAPSPSAPRRRFFLDFLL